MNSFHNLQIQQDYRYKQAYFKRPKKASFIARWVTRKKLTPGPRILTTDRVRGLTYGPVHGLPLRTRFTDHSKIEYKQEIKILLTRWITLAREIWSVTPFKCKIGFFKRPKESYYFEFVAPSGCERFVLEGRKVV